MPPLPSSTRSERESAVSVSAGSASGSSVADHDGHLDEQVVPGLGRRARPLRPHRQSGVLGPEHVRMDAP